MTDGDTPIPEWAQCYTSLYTSPYGFHWEAWDKELRAALGQSYNDYDLVSAIRWTKTKEAGKWTIKTASDVLMAYRTRRKRDREADAPPVEDCAICNHGWLEYYPKLPPVPTIEDFMACYCAMLPCPCPAGQRVMSVAHTYKDMTERETAILAGNQRAAVKQTQARMAIERRMDQNPADIAPWSMPELPRPDLTPATGAW